MTDPIRINGASGIAGKTFTSDPIAYFRRLVNAVQGNYGREDFVAVGDIHSVEHLLAHIEHFYEEDRKLPIEDVRTFKFLGVNVYKNDGIKSKVVLFVVNATSGDPYLHNIGEIHNTGCN